MKEQKAVVRALEAFQPRAKASWTSLGYDRGLALLGSFHEFSPQPLEPYFSRMVTSNYIRHIECLSIINKHGIDDA
jgi:hypothetical protein